jgi:hypothetical protein
MGDTSQQQPMDASVDKLCEIFSKVLEQQQPKAVPEIIKQVLEPNLVKLSDPENYVSSAHHVKLILGSHGYESLLLAVNEEGEKGGEKENKQINDRVLVWLLSSMEPTIREQVETFATVAEVWLALENQFAEKIKQDASYSNYA